MFVGARCGWCRSSALADVQLQAPPSTAKRLLEPHLFGRCQNKRRQCDRHSEISPTCVPKTSAFRPSIDLDIALEARERAGICDLPSLPKVMGPHGGQKCTTRHHFQSTNPIYHPHTSSDDETRMHSVAAEKAASRRGEARAVLFELWGKLKQNRTSFLAKKA